MCVHLLLSQEKKFLHLILFHVFFSSGFCVMVQCYIQNVICLLFIGWHAGEICEMNIFQWLSVYFVCSSNSCRLQSAKTTSFYVQWSTNESEQYLIWVNIKRHRIPHSHIQHVKFLLLTNYLSSSPEIETNDPNFKCNIVIVQRLALTSYKDTLQFGNGLEMPNSPNTNLLFYHLPISNDDVLVPMSSYYLFIIYYLYLFLCDIHWWISKFFVFRC